MVAALGVATPYTLTMAETSITEREFYEFKTDIALTKKTVENIEKLIEKQNQIIEEQGEQIERLLVRTNDLEHKMKNISYLAGVLIAIIIPILITVILRFFNGA